MTKCPTRRLPVVLRTARTFTEPLPLTGIAVGNVLFTTSHAESDDAVQVHALPDAVTTIVQFASGPPTSIDVLSSVTAHAVVAPACATVKALPAIVSVAERAAPL